MSGYEHILQTYDAMCVKSAQMVEAAKNSDWDRLIALEKDCSTLVATLKHVDDGGDHPGTGYIQRKAALISKILADDAEIRKYTESWMTELQVYLGSVRQERRLQQAYDDGGTL